ncbi:hypothetical protein BT69DRAFT_1317720 [Atractiella rhizophila]|nr:hypothetical protein BT69DRAFT_1317720 [Atractiella rhizophila]
MLSQRPNNLVRCSFDPSHTGGRESCGSSFELVWLKGMSTFGAEYVRRGRLFLRMGNGRRGPQGLGWGASDDGVGLVFGFELAAGQGKGKAKEDIKCALLLFKELAWWKAATRKRRGSVHKEAWYKGLLDENIAMSDETAYKEARRPSVFILQKMQNV